MDLKGRVVLVIRGGLVIGGTEKEARTTSWSESAGKWEWMLDKRGVTAGLEMIKSRMMTYMTCDIYDVWLVKNDIGRNEIEMILKC